MKLLSLTASVFVLLSLAASHERNGFWKDDVILWSHTIERSPSKSRAHTYLGMAYGRMGKDAEAVATIEEAVRLAPDDIEARYNLGVAYLHADKIDKAAEEFSAGVALRPDLAESYAGLADVSLKRGSLRQAVPYLLTAVRLKPNQHEYRLKLGSVYAWTGDLADAERVFKGIIADDPTDATALSGLVAGVGYQVHVPLSTYYNIPDIDKEVSLHIHTHVREDSLSLFGFLTQPEKELFLLLMGVSGIGPKLALSVLSSMTVDDICSAVCSSDDAKLCAIPGVGKKTAARLVLELKDRIKRLMTAPTEPGSAVQRADDAEDAISALVNLGYKRPLAEDTLKKIKQKTPEAPVEALIRDALRELVKK